MAEEMKHMGIMATQALQNTIKHLAEAYVCLNTCHRYATLAQESTAPDFREPIKTLMEQVDSLAERVREATPDNEKHFGLRRLLQGDLTQTERERIEDILGHSL